MMKKFLCMLMAVMMLLGAASAENLTVFNAGGLVDISVLENHAAVTVDQANGSWSALTYQTEALLDWFWEDGSRKNGPVLLVAGLEGSTDTGLTIPVLYVYHMIEDAAQNVQAVSVLTGDVRYDFAVVSRVVSVGSKYAEVLSAPLNSENLTLIDAILQNDAVSVRLMGDEVVTVSISSNSTDTKQWIEYSGLQTMQKTREMLEAAGVYAYGLWDLNDAAWKTAYGTDSAFMCGDISNVIGEARTTDEFGMVLPGETGNAATAAQEILRETGFMAGANERNMTERVVAAVKRAQKYCGLIETGCFDGTLAQLLMAEVAQEAELQSFDAMVNIGGIIELSLNRYWTTEAVKAQYAAKSERVVSNSDRKLIAADGYAVNLTDETLRMMLDAKAVLKMNGQTAYEALIVCECNGATKLDTQLLAHEEARVIVYAEVPQHVLQDEAAAWTIEVTAGGETVIFNLD